MHCAYQILCLCLTRDITKQAVSGRLDFTICHAGKVNKEDDIMLGSITSGIHISNFLMWLKTPNMKKTSIFF